MKYERYLRKLMDPMLENSGVECKYSASLSIYLIALFFRYLLYIYSERHRKVH